MVEETLCALEIAAISLLLKLLPKKIIKHKTKSNDRYITAQLRIGPKINIVCCGLGTCVLSSLNVVSLEKLCINFSKNFIEFLCIFIKLHIQVIILFQMNVPTFA